MAKSNTNGNGADVTNGCAITPTIHLVLQGKGGVGKTVVAGWLAEFLIHRGQPVRCIDGDPVNRSLAQYKALPVEKLDLLNQDGVVMRARYDALVDPAVLREAGRRVYVHIPISGGEMLNDTLLGFKTLAETAAEKSLVVWINEYFGAVARDGKKFDQMQVYLDNREKVLASVGIPERPSDTFAANIRRMRELKLTFEEAIRTTTAFYIVEKQRLCMVQRDLFEQLEQTPFA